VSQEVSHVIETAVVEESVVVTIEAKDTIEKKETTLCLDKVPSSVWKLIVETTNEYVASKSVSC